MKTKLRVKEVAQAKGISMTKLSHRSEVAYKTIQKIFRNPYAPVTLVTLDRIAEALGVRTSELLDDSLVEENVPTP